MPTDAPHPLVALDDIRAAAARIADRCVRTPLLAADPQDAGGLARPQHPLHLKPENLQPSGAFKLRGATNAVARLDEAQRAAGVVTHSSGNHGQALARAARAAGIACTVVAPTNAPQIKLAAMQAAGADVRLVPMAERSTEADEIVATTGATLVPPFDHADVIAGQGTVGLEIVDDLVPATVFVPVGGGGLISGIAAAVKAVSPHTRVVGVEPELAADATESFGAGERRGWDPDLTGRTVADGLRSPALGELTYAHMTALVDDVVTVSEQQILDAMRAAIAQTRTIVEPSGAVALAGYLAHPDVCLDGPAVAVISGGNADPGLLRDVMGG